MVLTYKTPLRVWAYLKEKDHNEIDLESIHFELAYYYSEGKKEGVKQKGSNR